jgi:acetyl esterase/lipase
MLEKVKTPPWPPRMWSTANLRTIAVQQGSEGFSDFLVGANGPGPAMFETSNLTLPVEPGEARIRVLVPIPVPTATIVWFLDEFSLLGGLEGFDVVARKLAERTGATFVLVDGTSVAHSHPGLLRLVDGVLDWLTKQSSEASWRDRMVVLGGIGTGALVAASAAIVARDRQAEIGLQVLVSPALFPRSAASGDGPAEEPNDLLTEEIISDKFRKKIQSCST